MHCEAHPFEEALAVLLLLGLMSPAWCCLWLGTVPLPAHTAVGSSSVLRLPELWSNSHCMTSSCVLQGWVRAGVRILLSRVHVPHLVPLHPLSWSKQILPLHLIKSNGAEQEPTPTWAMRQLSCLLQEASKGCSPFLQVLLSGSPFREAILRLLLLKQAVTKSWPFFVLVCAAGGLFSTSLCAQLSSHSFQRPFPPMAAIPTAAHPSPPSTLLCSCFRPSSALCGDLSRWFLTKKASWFPSAASNAHWQPNFQHEMTPMERNKSTCLSWCAWSRKVICIQMKIKINQNLFLHVQGGETSSSSGRSTLHWVLQNNVSLFYTMLFIRSYIFIF